jgi:hypothetical protein
MHSKCFRVSQGAQIIQYHDKYMNLNISLDRRKKTDFPHIERYFGVKTMATDQHSQKIIVNIY